MPKISAGILVHRMRLGQLEVLLVHPGGPFWAKRDLGSWSIPKGEAEADEDLLHRAVQELQEETGFTVAGPFTPLLPARQSGKLVYAWAAEGDGDADAIVSNTFRIEYPPRSGRFQDFPEVDRAGWFDLATAHEKILPAQRIFLDQLKKLVAE
ncbi:MAG: NUDIX domain-containing protein [Candidatus Eremiobacteraeota bacterium]|nr:NUDIX domain-containing protein [Candidatus Eremiobacteraeota bacterium]